MLTVYQSVANVPVSAQQDTIFKTVSLSLCYNITSYCVSLRYCTIMVPVITHYCVMVHSMRHHVSAKGSAVADDCKSCNFIGGAFYVHQLTSFQDVR